VVEYNTTVNCSDTTYHSVKAPRKFVSEVTRNRLHNTEHNNAQQDTVTEQNSWARTVRTSVQNGQQLQKISCYVTVFVHAHIYHMKMASHRTILAIREGYRRW